MLIVRRHIDSWHTLSDPYPVYGGLNKQPYIECTRCGERWAMDDKIATALEIEEDSSLIVHAPCKHSDMDH